MTTLPIPRRKLRKSSYLRDDLYLRISSYKGETEFQFTAVTTALQNGSYDCEDLLRKLVRELEAKGFNQQARKFASIYLKEEN